MAKKTYAESVERLEEILESIDRADLGVDELAKHIEEASSLLKYCKGVLKKTESQVQDVLNDLDEEFDKEA